MGLSIDRMKEVAYDIATEIVVGGDRFDAGDIRELLDGISGEDLSAMKRQTEFFARKMQPGIGDDYLSGAVASWFGLVRCKGQRAACRPLDSRDAEHLRAQIALYYETGFRNEYMDVRDTQFNRLLDGVAQKDIDALVDGVYHQLRESKGEEFSPNHLRAAVDFFLSGVQSAEFHNLLAAYHREKRENTSFLKDSLQLAEEIASYVDRTHYSVGDGMRAALQTISEREEGAEPDFHVPMCDGGLMDKLLHTLNLELVFGSMTDDAFLRRSVLMSDGVCYDRIQATSGGMRLVNIFGDTFQPENVMEAYEMCNMCTGNILDRAETLRREDQMSVGFALMNLVLERGKYTEDGTMRLDLPGLTLDGRQIRGIEARDGLDGDTYYRFFHDGPKGEEASLGMNRERVLELFSHLDTPEAEGAREFVDRMLNERTETFGIAEKVYNAQKTQEDPDYGVFLQQEQLQMDVLSDGRHPGMTLSVQEQEWKGYVFDLESPVDVRMESDLGGLHFTVTQLFTDVFGELLVRGATADGKEVRCPMGSLTDSSVESLRNCHELRINWDRTVENLKDMRKHRGMKI